MSRQETEESVKLSLDFSKLRAIVLGEENVLPVAIQDFASRELYMIAYVNAEALRLSLGEKRVVLYSTSRREIWRKGETSGDTLRLDEVRVNCEQNSLLFLVTRQGGGVCHTRGADGKTRRTCYYRRAVTGSELEFV